MRHLHYSIISQTWTILLCLDTHFPLNYGHLVLCAYILLFFFFYLGKNVCLHKVSYFSQTRKKGLLLHLLVYLLFALKKKNKKRNILRKIAWCEGIVKTRKGYHKNIDIGPMKTQKGTKKAQIECIMDLVSTVGKYRLEKRRQMSCYINCLILFELLNKNWSNSSSSERSKLHTESKILTAREISNQSI